MEKELLPIFPLELERIIFELAAEEIIGDLPPTRCALNLQLTAGRVRSWVRPLIYRVFKKSWSQDADIIFRASKPYPAFKPEEVGPFVKHLFLRYTSYSNCFESMKKIVQYCPNTQNIAVWCGAENLPKVYPIFSYLTHLKRFSGCFEDLSREQMLSPVFRGLTHLQIGREIPLEILVELKKLTHLRICIPNDSEHRRKDFVNRVCSADGCPWLQIIKVFSKQVELVEDIRIVIMPSWMQFFVIADADWLDGVNGKMDSWEFSSRIVHARKSGYMAYVPNRVFDMNKFDYKGELNEAGQAWWRDLS